MKEYICFYHQEFVMTYCVKVKSLSYDESENKFREYLKQNGIAYINDSNLMIVEVDNICEIS